VRVVRENQVELQAHVGVVRDNQGLSGERVVLVGVDGLLAIALPRRPGEHAGFLRARGTLPRLRDSAVGARRGLSGVCVDEPRETPRLRTLDRERSQSPTRLVQETLTTAAADLRVMTSHQTTWRSELSVASGDLDVATETAMKRRASSGFVPETWSIARETIAAPTADLRVITPDRAFVWLSRIVVRFERAVVWFSGIVVWFSGIVAWFSEIVVWFSGIVIRSMQAVVGSIQAIVWFVTTFPWFAPGGVRDARTSIPAAGGDLAAIRGSLASCVSSPGCALRASVSWDRPLAVLDRRRRRNRQRFRLSQLGTRVANAARACATEPTISCARRQPWKINRET
jgi:hypothetical protein